MNQSREGILRLGTLKAPKDFGHCRADRRVGIPRYGGQLGECVGGSARPQRRNDGSADVGSAFAELLGQKRLGREIVHVPQGIDRRQLDGRPVAFEEGRQEWDVARVAQLPQRAHDLEQRIGVSVRLMAEELPHPAAA